MILVTVICLYFCAVTNAAEVSEVIEEHPRVIRHHIRSPKVYKPPEFNYRTARQQDQQKLRYYQQQKVNFQSLSRNKNSPSYVRPIRSNSDTNSSEITLERLQTPKWKHTEDKSSDINKEASEKKNKSPLLVVVKGNTPLKDIVISNETDLDLAATEARPTVKRSSHGEDDLYLLNSLLGKPPTDQLRGLHQLLQNPNVQVITQDTHGDVPQDPELLKRLQAQLDATAHSQTQEMGKHPTGLHQLLQDSNVQIIAQDTHGDVPQDPELLKRLQAQLDATAHSQTQEMLAMAQQRAKAVVDEQHRAIEEAKRKAEAEAMEKVRAQNAAIEEAYGKESSLVPAQTRYVIPVIPERLVVPEEEADESRNTHEDEDVSTSCGEYVKEKLSQFKRQYCSHFRKAGRSVGLRSTLKDFILELNCTRFENVRSFFANKLKELYKKNRKQFFMLCVIDSDEINLQFTHQFDYSNNISDFNENFMRAKRDLGYNNNYNSKEHVDENVKHGTPSIVIINHNSNNDQEKKPVELETSKKKHYRRRRPMRPRRKNRKSKAFHATGKINQILANLERF